jgi:hypothetical protein
MVAKFFLDMMRHDNSTLFPHRCAASPLRVICFLYLHMVC